MDVNGRPHDGRVYARLLQLSVTVHVRDPSDTGVRHSAHSYYNLNHTSPCVVLGVMRCHLQTSGVMGYETWIHHQCEQDARSDIGPHRAAPVVRCHAPTS